MGKRHAYCYHCRDKGRHHLGPECRAAIINSIAEFNKRIGWALAALAKIDAAEPQEVTP